MTLKESSTKRGKSTKPINNKPFWYCNQTGRSWENKLEVPVGNPNIEYWDSILEFKVYHELLKVVPYSAIKRQHTINILEAKYPFPAWNWNVDFLIHDYYLVEAKGKWLLECELRRKNFLQTLRILQETDEHRFNSLILVDHNEWIITGTKIRVAPLRTLGNLLKIKMGG